MPQCCLIFFDYFICEYALAVIHNWLTCIFYFYTSCALNVIPLHKRETYTWSERHLLEEFEQCSIVELGTGESFLADLEKKFFKS